MTTHTKPATPSDRHEPLDRYAVGYLTGYQSGTLYAISVIQPLVDPPPAEPEAVREALRMLSDQIPDPTKQ